MKAVSMVLWQNIKIVTLKYYINSLASLTSSSNPLLLLLVRLLYKNLTETCKMLLMEVNQHLQQTLGLLCRATSSPTTWLLRHRNSNQHQLGAANPNFFRKCSVTQRYFTMELIQPQKPGYGDGEEKHTTTADCQSGVTVVSASPRYHELFCFHWLLTFACGYDSFKSVIKRYRDDTFKD